jgi:hypothetical protein
MMARFLVDSVQTSPARLWARNDYGAKQLKNADDGPHAPVTYLRESRCGEGRRSQHMCRQLQPTRPIGVKSILFTIL